MPNTFTESYSEDAPNPFTEPQFRDAFEFVANQVGIPQPLREQFCKELFKTTEGISNPREQTAIVEKYINLFDFQWEDGLRFAALYRGKTRNPRKQCAEVLGSYILSRAYSMRGFERQQRTSRVFPYLLLRPGNIQPCPIHAGAEYLLLPTDHIYWKQHELATSVFCHCWLSTVSRKQLEKYRKEGVIGHDDPVYDERGLPTGHVRTKLFPIKETPP